MGVFAKIICECFFVTTALGLHGLREMTTTSFGAWAESLDLFVVPGLKAAGNSVIEGEGRLGNS